jgi:hypothetical protein
MREMAPKVQAFASSRFADMDANHNGLITSDEFNTAPSRMSMSASEVQLFNHIASQWSEIGHVIGNFRCGKSTCYVYAIDENDVLTYPSRVIETWKNW